MLRACTREHDWDQPIPESVPRPLPSDFDLLLHRARLHGVEACAHLSLRFEQSVPDAIRAELEIAYHTALQVHLRATHDLGIAGACLDKAGIEWVSFKGPLLAEHVYQRSDLRSYSDLDLLVSPRSLRSAIEALECSGGTLLDRNWRLIRERTSGEVHVRLPTGTVADLHWHLFNQQYRREIFPICTDDVLARAIDVDVDGIPARTLSDEDTLVHLALHACQSGGTQLLWCKDIEQAVTRRPVDWDAVTSRALEWHAGLPTALMLETASRTLGFAVHPELFNGLAPHSLWRSLARVTDRWASPENWSGGRSMRRDLCIATRGDDSASAIALVRRVGSLVKKRDLGGPQAPDRNSMHPQSLHYPTTDPNDRAEYFARLEAVPDAE
jgi:hypothetical protein